jgi:TPR repeat protein
VRQGLFGFACFICFSLPTFADDWLKALLLFDAGRYQEAIVLLTPLAESGNLDAQEILYAASTHGYGVPADDAAALHWLEMSVVQGSPAAQTAMGHHYLDGRGVAMDEAQAHYWFSLAAQQGYAPAIYNLGIMTADGRGTMADQEEAWRLIKWAAELNDPDALFVAGMTLLANADDGADIEFALGELSKSAQLGQRQAHAVLGFMMEDFPEDPHSRIKSAFYYQMAANAGCTDVVDAAAKAAARLTPDEMDVLNANLDQWRPESDPHDPGPEPISCLDG